ncbi:amino acid transporter [Penicillium odoratum]|uniref:amino acid transporter n=1 Tax=Penicillium odoratum TaxID=1167516 RepID=UPI002548D030|nr:amino acid transporter [Penicillium odoratum]KAJ5759110.1 amino acid transporter [Penicillium odoratum]
MGSETKNPVRTLKIVALVGIGSLYMLVNIVYFAAVPKEQMLESGSVDAAAFFGNVFGKQAEKVMSVFVAFSAFGNILSVLFFQGQSMSCLTIMFSNEVTIDVELFKNLVVRCSTLFKPFRQQLVRLSTILFRLLYCLVYPQAIRISFFLSKALQKPYLISYPLSIIKVFVSGGLTYPSSCLEPNPRSSPCHRVFLAIEHISRRHTIIPPDAAQNVYKSFPFYLHCAVTLGLFGMGAVYDIIWAVLMPRPGGYLLVKEAVMGSGGWSRNIFTKVSKGSTCS